MSGETHDDRYAINLAYAEIREGYREGDVSRILARYAGEVGDLSNGFPSFGRAEAHAVYRERLQQMFAAYNVVWTPTIIAIALHGVTAISHGWHTLTATPHATGSTHVQRSRFLHIWAKDAEGSWRLQLLLDNQDHTPMLAEAMVVDLRSGRISPITGEALQPADSSAESR